MNGQLSLLDDQPGRARATDPTTSVQAARKQSGGIEDEVRRVFRQFRRLSDDALCRRLPLRHPPSVKSARSRLSGRGELVDTGTTAKSDRGVDQIVWTIR